MLQSSPSIIHVKDLEENALSQQEFDSIIVVSTNFNDLPSFPGLEDLKKNKEVDEEFTKSISLTRSENAPGKRLVFIPAPTTPKGYVDSIVTGVKRSKKAGSSNPLILLQDLPVSADGTTTYEKVVTSIMDSLRPGDKKRKDGKKKSRKRDGDDSILSPRGSKRSAAKLKEPADFEDDSESTIRLWHLPGSSSSRVLWLLKEVGGEYVDNLEVTVVKSTKELRGAFTEKINPTQSVPTIRFGKDGIVLWESGAIVAYILDKLKENENLFPADWTEENWNRHNTYSYWTTTTMDQKAQSGKSSVPLFPRKDDWWKNAEKKISEDLGENEYINGSTFTATDIFLGFTLHALKDSALRLAGTPQNIKDYYKRISEREAFAYSISQNINQETEEEESEIDEDLSSGQRTPVSPRTPRTPRADQEGNTAPVISSLGIHIFNDSTDYTNLSRALTTIEAARYQSKFAKLDPIEFAKLTLSIEYGPLVVTEEATEDDGKKDADEEEEPQEKSEEDDANRD